ncbi:MAG: NAD-binding protein [Chloroflexi bacterium]|nr:NAD-binding protein [Chloroflexota bacterium]
MKKITWRERLRYRFDNVMARGPIAMVIGLFLISGALIALIAAFVAMTGVAPTADDGSSPDFFELMWLGLLRTLDSGTMGGDRGSVPFLGAMLAFTFGGIFLVSALIGIINNAIDARLQELRKGKSFVVEQNQTLILGWSSQIFSIISELAMANANQKKPVIVILAEKDKMEMEDEIRAEVNARQNTRVVCRHGSPLSLADLEIVNPNAAKSMIILAPEVADPDTHVIKSILALTNNSNRRAEPYHIVAQIHKAENLPVARMVGGSETTLLLVGDLLARIIAQTCRQSGLSIVYTELLDFGGDEIYFKAEAGLVGKSFGDALLAYEDSALIGLRLADGRVLLNPPMETSIAGGDRVIVVSPDDDTIRLTGNAAPPIDAAAMRATRPLPGKPERTLVLGWNARAPIIVRELDRYVAPGSEVLLVAENDMDLARALPELTNQKFSFRRGETTDRRVLDELRVEHYDHIIVLSYSETLGVQEADAKTLITLLHLREISERAHANFAIVSEMLDLRNRELAEVTRADDFIVSDKLISLLLSQLSENKELEAVFQDLFDPAGSELYLKPAGDYVELGKPLNFYTVVESARRRGQVALGYRIKALSGDAAQAYGVRVNPKKSERVTFAAEDRVIVLAEE